MLFKQTVQRGLDAFKALIRSEPDIIHYVEPLSINIITSCFSILFAENQECAETCHMDPLCAHLKAFYFMASESPCVFMVSLAVTLAVKSVKQ